MPTDTRKELPSIPIAQLAPIKEVKAAARLGVKFAPWGPTQQRFPGKHTDPGAVPGASGPLLLLYDYFQLLARPYVGTEAQDATLRAGDKGASTRRENKNAPSGMAGRPQEY